MATKRRAHLFIEEWLRSCGFSDEDAARKIGVQRETVFRWRTEQHRLNPQKILKIADLLGCDPGDLWRMPGQNNLDRMLDDADSDTRAMIIDVVRRLLKK